MPVPRRIAGVLGEWHIWIYWSAWSLAWSDREIATSESTELEIDRALSVLNGESLTVVTAGSDDGHSSFEFDRSCILRMTSSILTWGSPKSRVRNEPTPRSTRQLGKP
jgi:hypothetical protein